MKSLLDLMDDELHRLPLPLKYTSVSEFINDDESSATFIRDLLKDDDFQTPDKASDIYDFAKTRARHSAITFLMGLVFRRFAGIFPLIPQTATLPTHSDKKTSDQALRMWLITSLYHDKAYYSEYIKSGSLDYRKTFKYFLLTDDYSDERLECILNYRHNCPRAFAHTYANILSYDQYARNYHAREKDSIEKVDHGILGGVIVFNDLVRKSFKSPKSTEELPAIKACCLTIAQHNIFKSDSAQRDKLYPSDLSYLYHDTDFRIERTTPLLLFLCLVDTLECVKRFSKGENDKTSLQTMTVLSSINISVTQDTIIIDYAKLRKRIKEKNNPAFTSNYERYYDGIRNLHEWTAFYATARNDKPDEITITFIKPKQQSAVHKDLAFSGGV